MKVFKEGSALSHKVASLSIKVLNDQWAPTNTVAVPSLSLRSAWAGGVCSAGVLSKKTVGWLKWSRSLSPSSLLILLSYQSHWGKLFLLYNLFYVFNPAFSTFCIYQVTSSTEHTSHLPAFDWQSNNNSKQISQKPRCLLTLGVSNSSGSVGQMNRIGLVHGKDKRHVASSMGQIGPMNLLPPAPTPVHWIQFRQHFL